MTKTQPTNGTVWDHVEQLRLTLLRSLSVIGSGMVLALIFYRPLFALLSTTLPTPSTELIILGPIQGAMATLKLAFWLGCLGTAPLWGYFILAFILPGLKRGERRLLLPFLTLSLLFVFVGVACGLQISLPLATRLLFTFNAQIGTNLWTVENYLSFTTTFLLGHGILFEALAILMFLVHLRVVTPDTLQRQRRLVIILTFTAAAILTPPDIITQCLLALPILALYEAAIIYGRLLRPPAKSPSTS